MREIIRFAVALLVVAGMVAPGVLPAYDYMRDENDVVLRITDEIDLTITGEIRSRMEWNENLVDFTDDLDDEFGFVPSRVRIGFGLDLPRDVTFYIEAQELFSFGEDTPARFSEAFRQMPNQPISGGLIGNIHTAGCDPGLPAWEQPPSCTVGVSGSDVRQNENARISGNIITSTHRDDLSLYQAHITADNIGDTIFGARLGRQELSFGNEWILGDNDFYGGATYDALRGWWNFERSRLDVFWAKLDEQGTGGDVVNSTDDDTDMYGIYFAWPEVGTSLIGYDLYAIGIKSNLDAGPQAHDTAMESYWLGGRVYRQPEWGFHFNAEATYQFGDMTAEPADHDIEAWGFEGMLGYTWDLEGNPDLHVGFTYATGDDDPADDDEEAFFAPMPDPHPRLGFADLFAATNLMAWQIGYAGSWENMAWGIELYHFETDQDVVEGEDGLADEVDVWFSYQYSRHLALQVAYSFVSLQDAIEKQVEALGYGADDAQRLYVNVRLLM